MPKININDLISSMQEVDWNYDFKVIKNEDGSATINIPDFIFRDIKWAVKPGKATPREDVICHGCEVNYGENENCYNEWTKDGRAVAMINGEAYYQGKPVVVVRNDAGEIVDFNFNGKEQDILC